MMNQPGPDRTAPATLRRALGLPLLLFYGLGTIVGAGIYVAIGQVVGRAGPSAPLSFVLAGLLSALTGLSYAELSARYPEAGGGAVYVQEAFGSKFLSRAVGIAIALAAIVATASIARGSADYLQQFLPLSEAEAAALVVLVFSLIACLGVAESVFAAAAITVVELGGLAFVIYAGMPAVATHPAVVAMTLPTTWAGSAGLLAGAFISFFAYIGFETMANMAEETREVERTLPRAILLAIGLAAFLYAFVALVAVASVAPHELAASPRALCLILEANGWQCGAAFGIVALLATLNGVLLEILMLGRLLYGMARRGWVPSVLGTVARRTRTPVLATLLAGGIILVLTLSLDFSRLIALTSTITLGVFLIINLGLWWLKRLPPDPGVAVRVPRWCPLAAALACLALLISDLVG